MFKIKNLDPTIRVLSVPSAVLLGSLVLIVFLIKTGYPKVMSNLSELKNSQKKTNTLQERMDVLEQFNKNVLANQSGNVFLALPDSNPGAAQLSQVKKVAESAGLTINSVSSSRNDETQDEIKKADIDYEVASDNMDSVLDALNKLETIAPLTSVVQVDILKEETGGIDTKFKTTIYWAELPTNLPSISEPLVELSAKNKQVLNELQQFNFPDAGNLNPLIQGQNRENPFN